VVVVCVGLRVGTLTLGLHGDDDAVLVACFDLGRLLGFSLVVCL